MSPKPRSEAFQRSNGMDLGVDEPALPPMPPEFELMHPRRVRCSGRFSQPDGEFVHYSGYMMLTPEDEARYRLTNPEQGLHPDDLAAFRESIRGPAEPKPIKHGPLARLLARLKFWASEVDDTAQPP